ncbi:MAG TPA: hypothetical protein VFX16_20500 [Pseudonocardiaceae bacterium]|nr:hypothetical protein [Pseudonocardiaceae bacterium]
MTAHDSGTGARPHVVVINRWREHYAEYEQYIDHATHRVTYISTEVGLGSVPSVATDTVLVDATDDIAEVRVAIAELVRRHGAPHRIVALKEDDLLVGAQLREDWGVPGQWTVDLVRFRDKYRMCQAVQAAGQRVPAFAAVSGPRAVLDFADANGWPVVLKPRVGSSSAGVELLNGPADLAEISFTDEPMLVQAYNPHPIYHVDGLFTGRSMASLTVSRYVNTCLAFRTGTFLGSVEVDDHRIVDAVRTAAGGFLRALTNQPTPVHLEVFIEVTLYGVTCTFLEVGARVGGAEIPFIWRDLHGYDLVRAAFDLQLCREPAGPPADAGRGEVGGWLLIPTPAQRPCRITEVTSMVGTKPGPYAEALLDVGEVLPDAAAYYEHVGGRFRFRGATSAEVETAIVATANGFRVNAEPVERVDAL